MTNNVHLNRSSKIKNDEFYTTYEEVSQVIENYIPEGYFKDKVIYSFCDSENSNFVKYIKSNKDILKYKQFIYTSDDYNTHIDLFYKADVIITNPPFSKIVKEIIPILNEVQKDFFIFGSISTLTSYYNHFKDKENVKFIRKGPGNIVQYILGSDSNYLMPTVIYITNIPGVRQYVKAKPFVKDIYTYVLDADKQIKNYDSLLNVPLNITEEILVPVTVLLEHHRQNYDIIKESPYKKFSDNKSRYTRMIVKRKA